MCHSSNDQGYTSVCLDPHCLCHMVPSQAQENQSMQVSRVPSAAHLLPSMSPPIPLAGLAGHPLRGNGNGLYPAVTNVTIMARSTAPGQLPLNSVVESTGRYDGLGGGGLCLTCLSASGASLARRPMTRHRHQRILHEMTMHIVRHLGWRFLPSAGTVELVEAFYNAVRAWVESLDNGWTDMDLPYGGGFGGPRGSPRGGPPGGPTGGGGSNMIAA